MLPRISRKPGPTSNVALAKEIGFAYARGSACLRWTSLTHQQPYSPHFDPIKPGPRDAGYALTGSLSVL